MFKLVFPWNNFFLLKTLEIAIMLITIILIFQNKFKVNCIFKEKTCKSVVRFNLISMYNTVFF